MSLYRQAYEKYKARYINEKLNPPIIIEPTTIDTRTFYVFRDDYLIGGTKQRMLGKIILNSNCKEFVYAGPIYGFAQIALAYVTSITGKKATLFLETKKPKWPLTKIAMQYSPNIIEVGYKAKLKYVQHRAEKYVDKVKKDKGKDYICLIPFGLHSSEYVNILTDQIKSAMPENILKSPPKRIWLVAGSATILSSLYQVFPTTFFCVVQVGKKIWPDQLDLTRTKLYISEEKFWEVAKLQPPYPTVNTYDAKLWKFVLEDGIDGDYIWNVGKTPELNK